MPTPLRSIAPSALSGSVEIWCVAPTLAGRIWPLVKDRLAQVLRDHPSDTTIEAMEQDVMAALQLVWIASDGTSIAAAALTALSLTPAHKLCTITLGFSVNTRLWDRFFPMVEEYARAEGCSNLRICGRRGWGRVLKDFREPWVVLDKELR